MLFICSDISACIYLLWVDPVIEQSLTAPALKPFTYIFGLVGFSMYWSAMMAIYTIPLQIGIVVFLFWLLREVYVKKAR